MPASKKKKLAIAERRQIVAANIKAGVKYRTIAESMGVGLATVARDVKEILAEWRAQRVDLVDDWIELQIARLDDMIAAIWKAALSGDLAAVDRVQRLMEHQGRLLKFDEPAPQTHVHTALDADTYAALRQQAATVARQQQQQQVQAWQPSARPTQ